MNKRPFLFGLGVGIIIGALLLQLMIVGERQASGLDSFQKEDAGEKLYTQSELDEQLDSEREKLQAQQGSSGSVGQKEQNGPSAGDDNELQSEEAANSAIEGNSQQEQQPPTGQETAGGRPADGNGSADPGTVEDKRIIVRIPPNTSLTEAAELLGKNNIITDKTTFIDLMRNLKVRAGYFLFTGSPSVQEVKKIITGKPMPPEEAEAELANKA